MSATVGGSPYGLGPYGKGPYGRATRVVGLVGAPRITFRPAPLILQAQANIGSAPAMWVEAALMWEPVPVDPCVPWPAIGTPWQALPNKAGMMFPSLS